MQIEPKNPETTFNLWGQDVPGFTCSYVKKDSIESLEEEAPKKRGWSALLKAVFAKFLCCFSSAPKKNENNKMLMREFHSGNRTEM